MLTSDQIARLQKLLRQGSLEPRVAKRCWVLLLAAQGLSHVEIGTRLELHRNGVLKIRTRFSQEGLDCLQDASRPGRPLIHSLQTKQKIVTAVCGQPPRGLGRWSARALASKLMLSKSLVHGVLVEHDLHPHRLRTSNFRPDPRFDEKPLEVIGLHMNPPRNALVLCMDEKIGIQALSQTPLEVALHDGKPRTWINAYVRHGHQTPLAAVDIKAGKATAWVNRARKTDDFVKFMGQVVKKHPGQRLYVVMDSPNTHGFKMEQRWMNKHPKVSFHDTPIHHSWVNLADCFFSTVTLKERQQPAHESKRGLVRFLNKFVKQYQKTDGPLVWTKGASKVKKTVELIKNPPKKRLPAMAKMRPRGRSLPRDPKLRKAPTCPQT